LRGQAKSAAPNANEAVFSRLINYNDVVMVNSTPGGGHISHHRQGSVGKFTKKYY